MTPPRLLVVVDTNVWISGLLTQSGAPAQLTRQVLRGGLPVFSAETFAELQERVWRPKFDRYVTIDQRKAWLGDLDAVAHWVEISIELAARTFCRDATGERFMRRLLG